MAHKLMFKDGEAAMMYVGEVPWHGLGQQLAQPPTAQEAIKAAHLDSRVAKKPTYVMSEGTWYQLPNSYVIVREDLWGKENCPIFATVSESYVPLQNEEAFSFFDGLIEGKFATYETAGALGNGERVWVVAKLKEDICIGGKDEVQRYILLANGHNAATAVRIILTPIRVVCQNTLSCALEEGKNSGFHAYHRPDMHKKLDAAREKLDAILRQYEVLADRFSVMVKQAMRQKELERYLEVVFPLPPRGRWLEHNYEAVVAEVERRRNGCAKLFENGRGNTEAPVRGSLWAAYNGVADWTDHKKGFTNRYQRLNSLFFGEAAHIKSRALRHALELIADAKTAAEIEASELKAEAPAQKPAGRGGELPQVAVPDDLAQALKDLAEGLS
jgi:phage/plasmid-like protein (TIGR03299 family)